MQRTYQPAQLHHTKRCSKNKKGALQQKKQSFLICELSQLSLIKLFIQTSNQPLIFAP